MVCFQRNEVIFNGKKCIVINVKDLSEQEGFLSTLERIKQLQMSLRNLSSELIDPLEKIQDNIKKNINEIRTLTSIANPYLDR